MLVFEYELLVFCLFLLDDRFGVFFDYFDGVCFVIFDFYICYYVF